MSLLVASRLASASLGIEEAPNPERDRLPADENELRLLGFDCRCEPLEDAPRLCLGERRRLRSHPAVLNQRLRGAKIDVSTLCDQTQRLVLRDQLSLRLLTGRKHTTIQSAELSLARARSFGLKEFSIAMTVPPQSNAYTATQQSPTANVTINTMGTMGTMSVRSRSAAFDHSTKTA